MLVHYLIYYFQIFFLPLDRLLYETIEVQTQRLILRSLYISSSIWIIHFNITLIELLLLNYLLVLLLAEALTINVMLVLIHKRVVPV